jgi:hypothetical protein
MFNAKKTHVLIYRGNPNDGKILSINAKETSKLIGCANFLSTFFTSRFVFLLVI